MNTKTLKMIEFSKRIEGLSEYYFSSKLREVKSLIDSGEDIINLGIGSPDLSPPTPVIKKLKDSLNVAGAHKYQSYIGVEKLSLIHISEPTRHA